MSAKLEAELAAEKARVVELRRYCNAAAHDYAHLAEAFRGASLEWADKPTHVAFLKTIAEFAETSEFMRAAAELRADPKFHEDELVRLRSALVAAVPNGFRVLPETPSKEWCDALRAATGMGLDQARRTINQVIAAAPVRTGETA